MPQEAGTVKLISNRGAGVLLERSIDIVPLIRSLVGDSHKYRQMKAATASLASPNATELIVREITALLPDRQNAPTEAAAA
jgi:UDP-N-acetylglucosamine:LPS N-acetylglucosamine transferase